MWKGFARRATSPVADRDHRRTTRRTTFTRLASCLLGLLLVLQIHLPHQSAPAAPADSRTIALARLGAAIGQPVTLCAHAGDPTRPHDPADPSGCELCIFCHAVAVGLVATPVAVPVPARLATAAALERPRADMALVRARLRGGATPRGPPHVG